MAATENDKVIALTAKINAQEEALHVWAAVGVIDRILATYPDKVRALAVLYTSTVLAARMQEAQASQQKDSEDDIVYLDSRFPDYNPTKH